MDKDLVSKDRSAPDIHEPRYSRRLSDKIVIAFHQACDQSETEVAARLLDVLEFIIKQSRGPADERERRSQDSLVAAHERLWLLRHPIKTGD